MEIEGFDDIISIIALAKKLHDVGRDDIIQEHFFDVLAWDSYFENMYAVISSIFSDFYSDYDECNEEEYMVFSDDVISEYYCYAWEFGRNTNTIHDKNPYIMEAESEVTSRLNFCYGIGFKLLGYTKTKRTAKQSKLIVHVCSCGCGCHDRVASSLIEIYKWFLDKVAEFKKQSEVLVA